VAPGNYTVIAVGDANNVITNEVSENNNSFGVPISVTAPVTASQNNTFGAGSIAIASAGRNDWREIVDLAIHNANRLWGSDDCTDFVWGITNLAGVPFFDTRGVSNLEAGDPLRPKTQSYFVPHTLGWAGVGKPDELTDQWERVPVPAKFLLATSEGGAGLSQAEVRQLLFPGDVVRVYTNSSQNVGHSFIVTSRSASAGSIMIVDNVDGEPDAIVPNRTKQHELFLFPYINEYLDDASNIFVFRLKGDWTLSGGSGDDTLTGGAGSDTLIGYGGADTMIGGAGNDIYFVDSAADNVSESSTGGDADVVKASANFTLPQNVEQLYLLGTLNINGSGNAAANVIVGNSGSNVLRGLAGADILAGGAGNDILYGGPGSDRLTGGVGADTFVFDAIPEPAVYDTIKDFNPGTDKIQLAHSSFLGIGSAGTLAAGAFRITLTNHSAADTDDRLIYNIVKGTLYFDADGVGGTPELLIAVLSPGLLLTSSDFIVL
jgi:Ca2+-binding RTX toxin-like protein